MKKANVKPLSWEAECVGKIPLENILLEILKIQIREDIEKSSNAKKVA